MDKKTLRKNLLRDKKSLPQEIILKTSQIINHNLTSLEAFLSAKTILIYASLPWEVDTSFIWDYALQKQLVFPKVEKGELSLIRVKNKESLKKGTLGINEPFFGDYILPSEIDLAVVPGIAFDKEGYRLGYGGGYYDKLLPKIEGVKIGLVMERFFLPKLPKEEHDIPVDIVVTELGIFRRFI